MRQRMKCTWYLIIRLPYQLCPPAGIQACEQMLLEVKASRWLLSPYCHPLIKNSDWRRWSGLRFWIPVLTFQIDFKYNSEHIYFRATGRYGIPRTASYDLKSVFFGGKSLWDLGRKKGGLTSGFKWMQRWEERAHGFVEGLYPESLDWRKIDGGLTLNLEGWETGCRLQTVITLVRIAFWNDILAPVSSCVVHRFPFAWARRFAET